jgi:transposase
LAQAIRYALNHWKGLIRFLDDGRFELDTNIVERAMRPVALGRNYVRSRIMRSSNRRLRLNMGQTATSRGSPGCRYRT